MTLLVFLLLAGMAMSCGGAAILTPTPFSQTVAPTRPPEATKTHTPVASPSLAPTSVPTQTPRPVLEATIQPATTPSEIPTEGDGPIVTIGETAFLVELATTVAQQVQGLSGRSSLAPGSGMLFVYEQQSKFTFWMKDMQFPLDIIWIGADCAVVDITFNAPPPEPGQTDEQLPRYSPDAPGQFVLEINAGEADLESISPGDPVEFTGSLAGRYGC